MAAAPILTAVGGAGRSATSSAMVRQRSSELP
jgi:hypothetical protein